MLMGAFHELWKGLLLNSSSMNLSIERHRGEGLIEAQNTSLQKRSEVGRGREENERRVTGRYLLQNTR
jgi:hypothetical protein